MRVVNRTPLNSQVRAQPPGELGRKADLHGTAVGLAVFEGRGYALAVCHIFSYSSHTTS